QIYEEGWNRFKHACFKYPRFAQVSTMQEEAYETHQRYLREMQIHNREKFKQTAVQSAKIFWPFPTWLEGATRVGMVAQLEADPQELIRVMPIKKCFGSLDMVHYYNGQP